MVDVARDGWMAPFALILMAFGLALFWAVACWGGLRSRSPLLGLVVGLGLADLARGYVLTGFPWALLGHVWIDTPVAQAAAWIGPTGLTLLTLTMAAGLAALRVGPGAMAGTLLAGLWGLGLWTLSQPAPVAPGITLRLVQPNAAQETKWDADHAQQNFDCADVGHRSTRQGGSGDLA